MGFFAPDTSKLLLFLAMGVTSLSFAALLNLRQEPDAACTALTEAGLHRLYVGYFVLIGISVYMVSSRREGVCVVVSGWVGGSACIGGGGRLCWWHQHVRCHALQVLTSMYSSLGSPTQSDRAAMAWLLLPLVLCLTCFVIDTHAIHTAVGEVLPCMKMAMRRTHAAFSNHGTGESASGAGLGNTPRGAPPRKSPRVSGGTGADLTPVTPGGTRRRPRERTLSLYQHDAVDVHVRARAQDAAAWHTRGAGWNAAACWVTCAGGPPGAQRDSTRGPARTRVLVALCGETDCAAAAAWGTGA
jgi:hypothetical protein